MLDRVAAKEIVREANSGRTRPLIVSLDQVGNQPVQAFCKVSQGLEVGAWLGDGGRQCLLGNLPSRARASFLPSRSASSTS